VEEQVKNRLTLTNRQQLTLEGVQLVDKFDEEEIVLATTMGILTLKGTGLHITQLDLEKGTLMAQGLFTGFQFREGGPGGKMKTKGKSFLGKFFR
jgi:sporulation protein YabP